MDDIETMVTGAIHIWNKDHRMYYTVSEGFEGDDKGLIVVMGFIPVINPITHVVNKNPAAGFDLSKFKNLPDGASMSVGYSRRFEKGLQVEIYGWQSVTDAINYVISESPDPDNLEPFDSSEWLLEKRYFAPPGLTLQEVQEGDYKCEVDAIVTWKCSDNNGFLLPKVMYGVDPDSEELKPLTEED